MNEIASIVLPFFGLIALGYGAGHWRSAPPEGALWLNLFVYYFALPALFFQLVAATPVWEVASWSFVLVTVFGTYSSFAVAFSVAALVNRGNVPISTIQGLVGSYSNSGYMAPGLTLAALGPAAAVPTALIFSFESALLFTIVPLMMALGGVRRTDAATVMRRVARSVFLHPFIIAIILGFGVAATGLRPPQPVDTLLTLLSDAAAPCALFALGLGLAQRQPKRVAAEVPFLVAIKLLIHPLIVYLLLGWIGRFDPIWVYTAVLMAALPPAANVFVMARRYQVYVEQASMAILIGTAASLFTVTALVALILSGALPTDPFH